MSGGPPRGGFVRRDDRALVAVAGGDRVRFLNGYVTADLAALARGEARSGFLTSREGRVLADLDVAEAGGRLLVAVPAGRAGDVVEHLGRYVLAADVEITAVTDHAVLGVYGDEAVGPAAETLHAAAGVVVARPLGALPGLELWGERGEVAAAAARLAEAGVPALDAAAFGVLRVAAGFGLWGLDFDAQHFPQETGRGAAAVSTTKGCYLGQEVVARIHFRGGVQRSLRALRLAGSAESGTPVLVDGREAGRLGTVVAPPEGGALALAVLHRRAGESGVRVELAAGGAATLFDPPFAAP
jgi:aminomethyltransferase